MEPKFQSSFIPKGPVATTSPLAAQYSKPGTSIVGFLSTTVFVLSIVLALGVFGYERYLLSDIGKMGDQLTSARATLQPDVIKELVDANSRLIGTRQLLAHHTALSPFFDYLENNTLKNVRYTSFLYTTAQSGLELTIHGQARSYEDVALQSDAFNRSGIFKNPVFSDLGLDDKGNVIFTFQALLDPSMATYQKRLEASSAAALPQNLTIVASSTPQTASTTAQNATTSATSTKSAAH